MKAKVILPLALLVLGAYAFTLLPSHADAFLNRVGGDAGATPGARARALHDRLVVADLHSDALLWNRDLLDRHGRGHVDLPRLQQGNVALQVFSVATKASLFSNYRKSVGWPDVLTALAVLQRWPVPTWTRLEQRVLHQSARLHDAAARSGSELVVIRSASGLARFLEDRARRNELVAGLLLVEGLHALGGDIENIDLFYNAGVRIMGLTHMFDNDVAGSAQGWRKGGLTPFGRDVVARMETREVIIDLAHASDATIDDVLATATRPVIVSHTGIRGHCPSPRNISDEHARRIAEGGGLIGIGFWNAAVCERSTAAVAAAVRYAVDLCGVDHVALGSDFDGTVTVPVDASGMARVTAALGAEGFDDDEISRIMGGNVVRFLLANLPKGSP